MNAKISSVTRVSYRNLSNPIYLKIADKSTIRRMLADFILRSPAAEVQNKLPRLLDNNKIRTSFAAFSKNIEDFSHSAFYVDIPLSRLLVVYRILLIKALPQLSSFIAQRDEIEDCILVGDYSTAITALNKLETDLGESIWLSRTKMLVLSALDDTDRFRKYCANCQSKSENTFNSFILKAAQLIADSGNAALQLGSVVHRTVAELQDAQKPHLSSLLHLFFTPAALEHKCDFLSCLAFLQAYPAVDLYCSLLAILRIELAKYDEQSTTSADLQNFAKTLSSVIPDAKLHDLSILPERIASGPPQLDREVESIYIAYKRGHYQRVLTDFFASRERKRTILQLANIAAKSAAYLGNNNKIARECCPLTELVSDLSTIYLLSPSWEQAEEHVASLSIKLNHFNVAPSIQLSLLKALPFRYDNRSQALAARMAISSTAITTPRTFFMADGLRRSWWKNEIDEQCPSYRRLRHTVLRHINDVNIDHSQVQDWLTELARSGGLTKDEIECNTSYYIRSNNDRGLVDYAADQLTSEANSHICLPMQRLVKIIEERQLCDINAVIICYHYSKNISDEHDFLLNETFEKYLEGVTVKKPSELLKGKPDLTDKELVFFRDICIPDIMDYLECFSNTNELRAERILILDCLEKYQRISSQDRMREVEQIVRQVIVDTGTTRINSAKIYINQARLRKKHVEEISSLISIYKRTETSEERFTLLSVGGGGYLSGNKNSVAEKMYNIVGSSYLFDEKYGLDKNLSGEIRHGFFSSLMRAKLEEGNLLTEKDEYGDYLPNIYWREENALIINEYWNQIDTALKEFSRDFNDLIDEAEEWMKISFQEHSSKRLFLFNLTIQELHAIRAALERSDQAEVIIDCIIVILDKKTDAALSAVRERLNNEFRNKLDNIFQNTMECIKIIKGEAALRGLMSCLTRVRNEIREDIQTVTLWFFKNDNCEISAGTLDELMAIAVRSFEKVRGNAYHIHLPIPTEFKRVPVDKRMAKPFILAMINLLDNCYSHSGLARQTRVSITGEMDRSTAKIIIVNNLSTEKDKVLTQQVIDSIHTKINNPDISTTIRSEGGTGLIKANHEISCLGRNSHLSIRRHKECFLAEIVYDFTAGQV